MHILVTGASGSGKSAFAEEICLKLGGTLTYIATMQPFGKEAENRIERHRAMRQGKGFATIEKYTALAQAKPLPEGTVLLECLGNLVANEIFAEEAGMNTALQNVINGVHTVASECRHLIVVTNDVFADGGQYPEETRQYIQMLAEVNHMLAEEFEHLAEVVCGIPIWHKGGVT